MGEAVTDQEAPWKLPRYPAAEAAARTTSFIEKWNGRLEGRIRAWAMPFSYETCSAGLLQALKRAVDERGTGLTLHHNSGTKAREDAVARYGHSPTAYLQSIGVLGPNVLLAHCLGLDEAGIKGYENSGWYGMYGPRGTPREVVTRVNAAIRQIVQMPDTRERFAGLNLEPIGSSPEEFAKFLKDDLAKYAAIAKAAGIKPE